jgi:hypothetical protein
MRKIKMTERELKNYTRGIAYQTVRFEEGEIDGNELIVALQASIGEDVFAEARKLVYDKRNKLNKSKGV